MGARADVAFGGVALGDSSTATAVARGPGRGICTAAGINMVEHPAAFSGAAFGGAAFRGAATVR